VADWYPRAETCAIGNADRSLQPPGSARNSGRQRSSVSWPGERAFEDIHDLLADRWRVGPPTYDSGRCRSSVAARSPKYSCRVRPPVAVTGQAPDEIAALTKPAIELRDVERRMAPAGKGRAAYFQGAEQHSRATLGRPLTPDDLEGVPARFCEQTP
jgi:hypothetical protein